MFYKLFPFKLQLQIFQLDEYSSKKLLLWVFTHFLTRSIENKKPLIWTQKARSLYYFSIVLTFIVLALATYYFKIMGIILGIFIATQPYLLLIIASSILLPFENYRKQKIRDKTQSKIDSFTKLKIIGVTGSYGKTSVKEILYQILKTQYRVLKTPESYNTPYGIAKVVDLELDDSYEFFICEMGAYRIGEIKEICDMVHPNYGILTGINEQHIETFGSLQNTTKGKFELIDSLPDSGYGVINIDNTYIKNNYQNYKQKQIPYGYTDEKFSIKNIRTRAQAWEFTLILNGKEYHSKTKLLGKPNLQNILAAATMSYLQGMKPLAITAAIANLKPIPHRLELKEQQNMTIIDDAYNSNVDGFKGAIELMNLFKQPKILITPGIVDLGEHTFSIHKELGILLSDMDYVILVGKSERTKGLKEGLKNKNKLIETDTLQEALKKISSLKVNHPVVLLENDLPDNY
jgi:UDP-N-acetylmuramoyl-tripeptide--D-alanyl-D-alanine ligase